MRSCQMSWKKAGFVNVVVSYLLFGFSRQHVSVASEPDIISPIKYLEGSLAASVAHGTTVAVTEQEFCILVSRTPISSTSSSVLVASFEADGEGDKQDSTEYGLPVFLLGELSSKWHRLTKSTLCTMTGFAADIGHLKGVLDRQVENYQALYNHPQPLQKTVRNLSNVLQRAAQRDGGRPFGIHALMVGPRHVDNILAKEWKKEEKEGYASSLVTARCRDWDIYTTDPTGAWRHHGNNGVGSIGRLSEKVRLECIKVLKKTKIETADDALKLVIESFLIVFEKETVGTADSDCFEGVLLWKDGQGGGRLLKIAKINPAHLEKCYRDCLKKIKSG